MPDVAEYSNQHSTYVLGNDSMLKLSTSITHRHMWDWLLQIKRLDTDTIGVDDGIGNYDYDNANDRENFCPDLGVSGV